MAEEIMVEEIMSEGGGGNGAPNQKKRSLSPGTSKSSLLSTKRLRLVENTAVGGTSHGTSGNIYFQECN